MRFVPLITHPRYQPLLDAMKAFGYCDRHIYETKRVIQLVQDDSAERTDDFYAKLRSLNQKHKNRFFDLVQNFEQKGSLSMTPSFKRKPKGCITKLKGEYKELIDYFITKSTNEHFCPSKIRTTKGPGAVFLLYLQNHGICSLKQFDDASVIKSFVSKYEGNYMGYIVKFLKICSPFYENTAVCEAIINLIQYKNNRSKVTDILTEEESDLINSVLVHENNDLSYEERALGLVFFYTGLRQCDVTKLTLSNVNWNSSTLNLIQSKTGRQMSVPLRPIVGNAIYRYLINERSKQIPSPLLFVTPNKWNMPLTHAFLRKVCNKIYDLAGVRTNGGRRGFHLFRHNLAIKLLECNVDMSVISNVLGHESPTSVEQYLGVTHKKLKECALSIKKFTLRNSIYGK